MRNTADVTGDKPIAIWSQSISGGNAINPLVAFYDIHGRKGEALYFDGRFGLVVGILAYYARGRDSLTVQTFVFLLGLGISIYNMYVFTKKNYKSIYLSVI
jgi:hypothetical protein